MNLLKYKNMDDISVPVIKKNRIKIVLLLITILAFSLRLGLAVSIPYLKRDEIYYFNMVDNWIKYGISDWNLMNQGASNIPPLLPLILYIFKINFNASMVVVGRLLLVLVGSLLPLIIYGIVKNIFQKKNTALIAALIIAVHPMIIRYGVLILRDGFYLFTIASTLYFATYAVNLNSEKISKYSCLYWSIASWFIVLGTLFRKEGIELFIGIIIWFAINIAINYKNKKLDLIKNDTKNIACFCVCFFIFSFLTLVAASEFNFNWNPYFNITIIKSDFLRMIRMVF